jgi:hypothetical protein
VVEEVSGRTRLEEEMSWLSEELMYVELKTSVASSVSTVESIGNTDESACKLELEAIEINGDKDNVFPLSMLLLE